MSGYRVTFCGVFPSLLAADDKRVTYTRLCESREVAKTLFDDDPSAVQVDRWEPEIRGWVPLDLIRDKRKGMNEC